ncbi:MAG: hypothetical protein ACR2KG_11010 [Nocardioidaceae bacterium]
MSDQAADPTSPEARAGQPPGYPGYGGQQSYPGREPGYPGQQGEGQQSYPGQQQGYPDQPAAYPGQPAGYPSPPPSYSGQPPSPQWQPSYGGSYPPAYPGMGGYGGEPVGRPGWSGLAIAAFVVAFLPLLGLFAVVPLAIIALVNIGKTGARGKWLAIAALIISVLWWVAVIGIGVWYAESGVKRNSAGVIVTAGRIDFANIRAGDCVTIPNPGGSGPIQLLDVKGLPCSAPHDTEAVGLIPVNAVSYPGSASLGATSQGACVSLVEHYLGSGNLGGYQAYRLIPDKATWENSQADHHVACFVAKAGFGNMTGSVQGG